LVLGWGLLLLLLLFEKNKLSDWGSIPPLALGLWVTGGRCDVDDRLAVLLIALLLVVFVESAIILG